MKFLGVIPARYASTRFPGKPLADIRGKSMIQRVYEQALKVTSLNEVIVATDDIRIYEHVKAFGGNVMLTSTDHINGTSRVSEVLDSFEKRELKFDVVINIQGDEPFIKPAQIDLLAGLFNDEETDIATLCKKIEDKEEIFDPNVVKVVRNTRGFALYFSRAAIPFGREYNEEEWINKYTYFKHLGIYGYRSNVLKEISVLSESELEKTEKLEQLRWLENGFKIKLGETDFQSLSVDTPEDLERILKTL